MALPREVCVSLQNNALGRPTPQSPAIENIGLFRGLSNRDGPPDKQTAAPVGAGNGGGNLENSPKVFGKGFYTASPRDAIAERFPIIATHFGIELLEAQG